MLTSAQNQTLQLEVSYNLETGRHLEALVFNWPVMRQIGEEDFSLVDLKASDTNFCDSGGAYFLKMELISGLSCLWQGYVSP
jgi:hypothetical protein